MKTKITLCVLLAALTSPLRAADTSATATQVFDRHFEASGGRDAFRKIETVTVKGTGYERQAVFNFELKLKKPGQILLVISNDTRLVLREGRDSNGTLWRTSPEIGETVKIPSDQAGEFMNLTIGFFPPGQLFFQESLAKAVCVEQQDETRTLIAVGKAAKNSAFPTLFFDKASGLLRRVDSVVFDDYREVNGVKLPFRATPDARSEFMATSIELNTTMEDSLFASPSQVQSQRPAAESDSMLKYQTLRSPEGKLTIVRHPSPANFNRGKLRTLPSWSPTSTQHGQVDLRGYDLRALDLSTRLTDLLHSDFDSQTRWPAKLPPGFDCERIMDLGKNPGLGVRELHRRGITGKGVGIGIIDQTLMVDHAEYRDRLRLYEEVHNPGIQPAQMHGPAVASIAVGKSLGVAPEADLYYIAETHGVFRPGQDFEWDFTWLVQAINRLLDVNQTLSSEKKIRVISISVGWRPEQKGYAETMAAVERATKQGVFVVSTAIEATHILAFHGLGREALSDPDKVESFGPGSWWAPQFWSQQFTFKPGERLLVPMDSRTTASPTGTNDYVFYTSAGWSWSVPWISGLYALACEVKPDITPEVFWDTAMKTGKTIKVRSGEKEAEFGTIVDPVRLIETISGTATTKGHE